MEISKIHDISILHLFGEVGFMEIDRIEKILNSLRRSQHRKVLVDLSATDHVHYMVIKRLIQKAVEVRGESGDIKLVGPNWETQEMIRFTGADQFIEDYASISEAILSFLHQPQHSDREYQ